MKNNNNDHLLLMCSLYGIDELLYQDQCQEKVIKKGDSIDIKKDDSIDDYGSLEKLYQYICDFKKCSLKDTAINTVFSDGIKTSEIMIIGEAPGEQEDLQGKPFVGLSGTLLDKMFNTIGLSRNKNIYISNIVPWRPPGNRNPNQEEIKTCLPLIEKHIEIIAPKIVVLIGGVACKALLRTNEAISKLRGKAIQYKNIKAFCMYHPAYLLRSPGKKKQAWQDLIKLNEIIKNF